MSLKRGVSKGEKEEEGRRKEIGGRGKHVASLLPWLRLEVFQRKKFLSEKRGFYFILLFLYGL
jgi:hypothetical protein